MRLLSTAFVLLLICSSNYAAAAASAPAKTKQRPAAAAIHPRLTLDSALTIAKAKVPTGTVKSHELERENGHLIYSFDFVVAGRSGVDEVNVDAMSGAVLGVEHEGPKAEHREKVKEKGEAKTPTTAH